MPGAPRDVGVVGVEEPDHHRVGEGRRLRRRGPPLPENPRRRRAVPRRRHPSRDLSRLAPVPTHRAPERVDEMPLGLVNRAGAQVLVPQRADVPRQPPGRRVHQARPLGATRILPVRSARWAWMRAVLMSSIGYTFSTGANSAPLTTWAPR